VARERSAIQTCAMPVKTLPFGAPLQLVAVLNDPLKGTNNAVFKLKRKDGHDLYCADGSRKAELTFPVPFTGQNAHAHTTAQGPVLNVEQDCTLLATVTVREKPDLGTMQLGEVRVYHDWIEVETYDDDLNGDVAM